MTVIVRDFKKHAITEDELRILLSFVEEDIHDYQRQSTAFPLLKVRGVRGGGEGRGGGREREREGWEGGGKEGGREGGR